MVPAPVVPTVVPAVAVVLAPDAPVLPSPVELPAELAEEAPPNVELLPDVAPRDTMPSPQPSAEVQIKSALIRGGIFAAFLREG